MLTGFDRVNVVTVGQPEAHFDIWRLPYVPRKENKEIMRTYLMSAYST
jgi:hypothetical protein